MRACSGLGVGLGLGREAQSSFPLSERNVALQQLWVGRAWLGACGKTDQLCPLLRPVAPELSHGIDSLVLNKRKMQCHSHPVLASLTPNKGWK